MALRNPCFKDQSWSHWRENRRERGREEKERRRKKKKRKSKQSQAPKRYGTTNLEYGCLDFGMELWILYGLHGIVSFICLNACLQT